MEYRLNERLVHDMIKSDSYKISQHALPSDRFFAFSIGFFCLGNYSKSRMGIGFLVLDRKIGIFLKSFSLYIILFFMSYIKISPKKTDFPILP